MQKRHFFIGDEEDKVFRQMCMDYKVCQDSPLKKCLNERLNMTDEELEHELNVMEMQLGLKKLDPAQRAKMLDAYTCEPDMSAQGSDEHHSSDFFRLDEELFEKACKLADCHHPQRLQDCVSSRHDASHPRLKNTLLQKYLTNAARDLKIPLPAPKIIDEARDYQCEGERSKPIQLKNAPRTRSPDTKIAQMAHKYELQHACQKFPNCNGTLEECVRASADPSKNNLKFAPALLAGYCEGREHESRPVSKLPQQPSSRMDSSSNSSSLASSPRSFSELEHANTPPNPEMMREYMQHIYSKASQQKRPEIPAASDNDSSSSSASPRSSPAVKGAHCEKHEAHGTQCTQLGTRRLTFRGSKPFLSVTECENAQPQFVQQWLVDEYPERYTLKSRDTCHNVDRVLRGLNPEPTREIQPKSLYGWLRGPRRYKPNMS